MHTWVNVEGFPLVGLTKLSQEGGEGEHELYAVSQSRFGDPPPDNRKAEACFGDTESAASPTWHIPVKLTAFADNTVCYETSIMLDQPQQIVKLPLRESGYQHIILNSGRKGYYRTIYSGQLTKLMLTDLCMYSSPSFFDGVEPDSKWLSWPTGECCLRATV